MKINNIYMNRRQRMYRLLAAAFAVAGALFCASAEDINLSRYLELVDKGNIDLKLAQKDSENAKQKQNQAMSQLLPTVAAVGSYTRNMDDVEQSAAVAASSQAYNGVYPLIYKDVDSNYDNDITLALSITEKLIDPASLAQFVAAKKGTQIQKTVTEYTRQQVLGGAKKLYAQTQLLLAVQDVKKESAQISEAVYHDTEKKYNAGSATEINLRMAEVDWKKAASEQAEAEKNVRVVLMAFRNLAGLPLDADVALTEKTDDLPSVPEGASLADVLGSRLDYQALLLAKETTGIAFKGALGSYLPSVSAGFTYAYGRMGGYEGKDDWNAYNYSLPSANIKVTIPLCTGGARIAAVKQAQIAGEESDLKIKQKRNEIEQQLVQLKLELDNAYGQIESARMLEQATAEALKITRAAFAAGMSTQLEVSKAMSQYSGAQVNLQNALYTYRAAYYDYELACGKTD